MDLTRLLMTIGVITLAIYDLIIVMIGGVDWSVSRWFQNYGYNAPYLLLVIGYLLGHWFGYMPPKRLLIKVIHSKGEMLVRANDYLTPWQLSKLGVDLNRPYRQEIIETELI